MRELWSELRKVTAGEVIATCTIIVLFIIGWGLTPS